MDSAERFKRLNSCVVIPTYNNAASLKQVLDSILNYTRDVIVVNDGSTDQTASLLEAYGHSIKVITHIKNLGKGMALRNAFKEARQLGYDYAITIDSDGQHFAEDLPTFLEAIEQEPDTLVIGARNMTQENVPGKSSFGNRFSNFWYWVETGIKLIDTQSGYRLYPIRAMDGMKFITSRFEFEVEVIVKAAWRGISVKNKPIKVHYEPREKRISHFRPFIDFSRISLLNTYLVTLALIYHLPKLFFKSLSRENIKAFLRKNFLSRKESAAKKAFSIGFGVFMGIFPIWGYQMLAGLALAHFMRLNKALFLVAANISIPPFIPIILYASYELGALLVAEPRHDILFSQGISFAVVKDNLVQYLFGAAALAFVAGLVAAICTYVLVKAGRLIRS